MRDLRRLRFESRRHAPFAWVRLGNHLAEVGDQRRGFQAAGKARPAPGAWISRGKRLNPAGNSELARPPHVWLGFPECQHGLVVGEKNRVAAASRKESHLCVGLALVGLKTERQLAVALKDPY